MKSHSVTFHCEKFHQQKRAMERMHDAKRFQSNDKHFLQDENKHGRNVEGNEEVKESRQ
jgi:hypothetical protein